MKIRVYWGDGPSPAVLEGERLRVRVTSTTDAMTPYGPVHRVDATVTVDGQERRFTYVTAIETEP